MPINPGADYKIKPQTEEQDALLRQYLQGGQEAYKTAAEGRNQQDLAQTQADLKQKGISAALDKLQGMKMAPGDSARVDDVSFSRSGEGKLQNDMLHQQAAAVKHTQDTYNHSVKPLLDQAQAVHELQQIASNPSQMNLGMARSAALKALGMNRFNESEAENVMPGTIQSGISRIFASGGKDEDALNSGQQEALNNFVGSLGKSLSQKHDTIKNMALTQYSQSPYADPSRADMLKSTLGTDVEKQLSGLTAPAKPQAPVSGMAAVTQPAAKGGMLDRLAGFLSGNKGAPAQAAAPQTATVSDPSQSQGQSPGQGQKQIVKTEVNRALGKTRYTYSDGTQEIK